MKGNSPYTGPNYTAGAWRYPSMWKKNKGVNGFGPLRHGDRVMVHIKVDLVFHHEQAPFLNIDDFSQELNFEGKEV